MAARTSPTFRRRRLARRVRHLREQAGMTQEEAAASLDMSTSALSHKETGETLTSVHEVRSMMDLYDLFDPELIDLARTARQKGWWRAYGIRERGYIELETEACAVREFQMATVPGLLQTADYARAVFATNYSLSEQLARDAVAARMVRSGRLADDESPLRFVAVIDESVLRRKVGDTDTMARQLAHLVKESDRPTATLQVLPMDSPARNAVCGSFVLLTYDEPEEPDLLYIEHVSGSFHTGTKRNVDAAKLEFDLIQAEALDASHSVKFIDRLRRQM